MNDDVGCCRAPFYRFAMFFFPVGIVDVVVHLRSLARRTQKYIADGGNK